MHELSIIKAVLDRLPAHTPRGRRVTAVHMSAGPLQAIDPESIQMAWTVATQLTAYSDTVLHVRILPYRWHCAVCGRRWQSDEMFDPCACGNDRPQWVGGDELTIDSLEVEPKEPCHASPRG